MPVVVEAPHTPAAGPTALGDALQRYDNMDGQQPDEPETLEPPLPSAASEPSAPPRETLGGIVHLVTDHLTGRGKREVVSLQEASRSSMPWWVRVDPYWEDSIYDAWHPWTQTPPAGGGRGGGGTPTMFTSAMSAAPSDADIGPQADGSVSERLAEASDETLDLWRRALGLIRSTGVIGDEQAAALLHPGGMKASDLPSLWPLAELGAIEGSWHHPPGRPWPRALLWRCADGEAYDQIVGGLADEDRVHSFFMGADPSLSVTSAHHVRHQQLATELALRALESSELWAGWIPEGGCTPDRFTPPDHPARRGQHGSMRSDGCLARIDGGRVFIEIQASPSMAKIVEKVQRWSRIFEEGPVGGVVLFVAASYEQHNPGAVANIKTAIAEYATPQAAQAMLVGQWQDYSPDAGQITADASRLRAVSHIDGAWQAVDASSVPAERSNMFMFSQTAEAANTPPWAFDRVPPWADMH